LRFIGTPRRRSPRSRSGYGDICTRITMVISPSATDARWAKLFRHCVVREWS